MSTKNDTESSVSLEANLNVDFTTPLQREPDYLCEDAVVLNIERTDESARCSVFVDEDDLEELTELTADEQASLDRCEATITRTKAAFYEFALALEEIKRRRLYRSKFTSFAQYCREVHGLGRSYAYRQAAAGKFIREKSPMGDKIPDNERGIRKLIEQAKVTRKPDQPAHQAADQKTIIEPVVVKPEVESHPVSLRAERLNNLASFNELYAMASKAYNIHADSTRRKELSDLLYKLNRELQAWAQSEEPARKEAA